MNIPHPKCLIGQTFNSEFIEFVWQFYRTSGFHDQLICKIWKGPQIYIEGGVVNSASDYVEEPEYIDLGYGMFDLECIKGIISSPLNWHNKRFPGVYKNFTNGADLIPLIKEVQEYLKSI